MRGDIVRFGGYVHVPADERLNGDVVLIGGRLRVDGEVTRDIVVIGGSAEFGPGAVVRRDVTVVGGRVTRHPDARFDRALNEVGFGGLDLNLGGFGNGFWWPRPSTFYSSSNDLMETFIRFAFLGLLGSVVLLVASGSAHRVADRVTREPVKAGVVGFCAQLLFLPLLIIGSVLLVITLIGIPLLALMPLVVVAALVVLLLGFTGVVQLVSRLFARGQRSDLVLFWVGLVLLMAPALFGDALDLVGGPFRFFAVILGVTGFLVEYLAWTAGSGAVILNWFGGDPTAAAGSPPPIPPPASPPSPLPPSASPRLTTRRADGAGAAGAPAGEQRAGAGRFHPDLAQERPERRVPSGDGAGGARELEEPGAGRALHHRRQQPEVRLVEALGRPRADRRHVGAGHVEEGDVEPVGVERGRRRDLEGRAAVRLLHLADPALQVGVDRPAAPAEVEHHQLAVLGVAGDPRQPELRDPHRRRGGLLGPFRRRVVAQRRLGRGGRGESPREEGEHGEAERRAAGHGAIVPWDPAAV